MFPISSDTPCFPTFYCGSNKKEVTGDIAKIIFTNIRDIRKQPPRPRAGVATHVVGTYDFKNHEVIGALVPFEISKQESYVLHNKELLNETEKLVAETQELTNRIVSVKANMPQEEFPEQDASFTEVQTQLPAFVHAMSESYKVSEIPVA